MSLSTKTEQGVTALLCFCIYIQDYVHSSAFATITNLPTISYLYKKCNVNSLSFLWYFCYVRVHLDRNPKRSREKFNKTHIYGTRLSCLQSY